MTACGSGLSGGEWAAIIMGGIWLAAAVFMVALMWLAPPNLGEDE